MNTGIGYVERNGSDDETGNVVLREDVAMHHAMQVMQETGSSGQRAVGCKL